MRSAVASAGSPTALSPAGKKPKLRRSFSATAAVPGLLPRLHARGNARPRIPAYTASWVTDTSFRRWCSSRYLWRVYLARTASTPVREPPVVRHQGRWLHRTRRSASSGAQGERLSFSGLYPRWAHNKHAWACFEATKTRQALLGAPLSQEDNACLPACLPARPPAGGPAYHAPFHRVEGQPLTFSLLPLLTSWPA